MDTLQNAVDRNQLPLSTIVSSIMPRTDVTNILTTLKYIKDSFLVFALTPLTFSTPLIENARSMLIAATKIVITSDFLNYSIDVFKWRLLFYCSIIYSSHSFAAIIKS